MEKQKKSKLLLVSWVIGVLYAVYLIWYTQSTGSAAGADSAEALGTAIGVALIMPHLVCVVLAVIFNILGWAMNKRGFALTGAILYAVSMILMPLYFMFVVIQMILSFIGFAKMKKPAEKQ